MRFTNITFGLALLAGTLSSVSYAQSLRSVEEVKQLSKTIVLKDARSLESSVYAPKVLEQLAQEIASCGLNQLAPACLDGVFEIGQMVAFGRGSATYETKDTIVLFSKISSRSENIEMVLVIEAEKDSTKAALRSVSVIELKKNSDLETAKNDHLAGRSKKILETTLPDNALEFLVSELNQDLDVRKLYHHSQIILKLDKGQSQRKAVIEALNSHHQIITNSDSVEYKLGLIKLLRSELASETELVIKIATELLNSEGAAAQLAAITLVDNDQKSDQISEQVRLSLKNSDWDIRRLGILSLNKIKNGTPDELLIINKLGDSDEDVQKTALSVINSFKLGSEHVSTLNGLTQNSNWTVRRAAINLLARISTPESRASVIGRLADSDEDVRKTSIAALNTLTVSEADLKNLEALVRNSNWQVRQASISFMGRIPSENATLAIITGLSDSDEDVRKTTISILNSRALTNGSLPKLQTTFKNANWSVRQSAISFMGKIPSEEATLAILAGLSDSDEDVRRMTINILNSRVLNDASVPKLQETSRNSNWSVRASAANLLAKIRTDAATLVLIPMLNDSDSDVKNATMRAIGQRNFNEVHVDALIAQLGSSNWDTRVKAARLIGTTNSCKGFTALKNRSTVESDSDVKGEISRSMSAIKSRVAICQ